MLTLYRGNRAELLAELLAAQLRLDPPGPFEAVRVVVNTWPTSRWLGERLALGLGDPSSAFANGVAANLRFPFPGSYLRELVDLVLGDGPAAGADPWRASELVWPLLEQLPALIERPEAGLLRRWLQQRGGHGRTLDRALWQLGRAIADAFDDYTLYRPEMVAAWLQQQPLDGRGQPLSPELLWQPLLFRELAQRLQRPPFALRVQAAIEGLRQAHSSGTQLALPSRIRLFGLSSMAPLQVELLQALSGLVDVELYLLTPCRELWRRREQAADTPLGEDWLLAVPRLEARYGRLGAEFQQLLEGTGVAQLGEWRERDLFVGAATAAEHAGRNPTLLEQLQEQLVDPEALPALTLESGDQSLEFLACPGRLRQVQIVRDRVLQLMAADPSLAPRDVLVMTPQVDAFAPLVSAVFGDTGATGVALPWRLTDRSQQSEAGISQGLLALLQLGGQRLTASALEQLLGCAPLLNAHGIDPDDAGAITALLQRAGFRWGLDGTDRGGDGGNNNTHSLSWAIDRLVLGLVLPDQPGLAPADTAPLAMEGSLEQQGRWLALLRQLLRSLRWLGRRRPPAAWVAGLRRLLTELFGDGGSAAWELQSIHAALADWAAVAEATPLQLAAPVVAEVLGERLSESSGRFGHRSGALTISALEPMRAIPHKVVVLMGLDAGQFPRQRPRPGFHLLEQQRQLGDPNSGDQDRYVLLESLLSARQHLLISWSCRDERTGEAMEACTPVRQWLEWLEARLPQGPPLRQHAAHPLERSNFLPAAPWPPSSCDQRLLQARQQLEQQLERGSEPARGLAFSATTPNTPATEPASDPWGALLAWLEAPQRQWLEQLQLRPQEWDNPVLDLEPLELQERQRAALLREQLPAEALDHPGAAAMPDWALLSRGRGLLPPQAAGELERQGLEQRWLSLQACLEQLGPGERRPVAWRGLAGELPWHGGQLVLVHTARPRTPQRLRLWGELLLACAAGQGPSGAALVGRDGPRFRVLEQLQAPSAAEAEPLLEQLLAWSHSHRTQCWPIPPQTGWAYASGEAAKPGQGRGWSLALSAWEGGHQQPAERREAVQALCFGADLPLSQLLTPQRQQLALALHTPLLERRTELKR